MSAWTIKFEVPPTAGWSESSDVKANPVGPLFVILNVNVAIVPLPLKDDAEPVEVANRWYCPVDCNAVSSITSIG